MEIASISLHKQNVLRWISAAGIWLRASQSFERQRKSSSYLAHSFVFLLIKIAPPFKEKLSTEIIFLLFCSMLCWVKKLLKQQVIDYSENSFQRVSRTFQRKKLFCCNSEADSKIVLIRLYVFTMESKNSNDFLRFLHKKHHCLILTIISKKQKKIFKEDFRHLIRINTFQQCFNFSSPSYLFIFRRFFFCPCQK